MAKKSSWIRVLFAWLLPLVAGTGMGIGIIVMLRAPQGPEITQLSQTKENSNSSQSLSLRGPSEPDKSNRPRLATREARATDATPKTVSLRRDPPQTEWQWEWEPLRDPVGELFRMKISNAGHLPLLYIATLHDDVEWVERLLQSGVNPNETTPAGDSALCAAVRHNCESTAAALIYGGADANQPGLEKQPPLALASLRRCTGLLRLLVAGGADPNCRFQSPVLPEVLEQVTIKDLRRSLESDRGVTPLIACASRGDVEGASILLNGGAKANVCTTRYKRYPINFAATQGYLFLMRIILGRQPESEPEILVTIDLSKQRAWLMKEGQIVDSTSVSTGRAGYATPAGRYVITDKHRSWVSTLYHVSMPFFMRLNCGAIGLHSGYVTGRPASHGCIRLPYDKAKSFFSVCRVGDEVQIVY